MVRFIPLMEKIRPEIAWQSPSMVLFFTTVSRNTIFALLVHAALVVWASTMKNSVFWLIACFAIYPILFLTMFISQ